MRLQRSSWQEIRRFCATAPASPSWAEKPRRRGLRAPASWPHGCVSVLLWSSADWRQASIPQPITRPWPQAAAYRCSRHPLDQVYPKTNMALQHQIMREHLCISQFPAGAPIHRKNFPMRNRTMALLSDATVIIEATDTSGSLARKGGKLCVSVGAISCRNQWRKTRPWRGRPGALLRWPGPLRRDARPLVRLPPPPDEADVRGAIPF